jgi:transporter family-2 protein
MYSAIAAIAGLAITVMNAINSRFAEAAGQVFSSLVVHALGLALVSAVAAVRREPRPKARLAPWRYSGGFVGALTLVSCNLAFARLGATMATALALLGQLAAATAIDAIGPFGRKRVKPDAGSWAAVAFAGTGAAIMWAFASEVPGVDSIALGLLSGALPVLAFALNSTLGEAIGPIRAARANYAAGSLAFLLVSPFAAVDWGASAATMPTLGPLVWGGGAAFGVAVVISLNVVYAKLPALQAGLLLFAGQALAGILVDLAASRGVDMTQAVGIAFALAGLAVRAALSRGKVQGAPRERMARPNGRGDDNA